MYVLHLVFSHVMWIKVIMWLLHFAPIYYVHIKIFMQILHLMLPHIMWIRVIMWVLHFALIWDYQVHYWCFYLNSRSEYFGICTTCCNNNNGLKVNSRTNLEVIGLKVPNPWTTMKMLGEAFNDLVSPTIHEGFNVFT